VFIVATNLLAGECFTDGWKRSKAGAFGTARGYGLLRFRSRWITGPISRNCRISVDETVTEMRIRDGTKQAKKSLRPNRTPFIPTNRVTTCTEKQVEKWKAENGCTAYSVKVVFPLCLMN
jgi:hypothetical protein